MTDTLKLREIAIQAGRQNGCRIYDIYRHRDRLQIFIDKQSSRVGLKDCENMFHSLRFLLHSELPHILARRRLEVSSPGIERKLREKWHFEESLGKPIKLTSFVPVSAQNTKTGSNFFSRSFTAILTSISKDELNLRQGHIIYSVPYSQIKTAHLIFQPSPKVRAVFNTKKGREAVKAVSGTDKSRKIGKAVSGTVKGREVVKAVSGTDKSRKAGKVASGTVKSREAVKAVSSTDKSRKIGKAVSGTGKSREAVRAVSGKEKDFQARAVRNT